MDPSAKRRRSEELCALVTRLRAVPDTRRALILRDRIELAVLAYAREAGRREAAELAYQLGDTLAVDAAL